MFTVKQFNFGGWSRYFSLNATVRIEVILISNAINALHTFSTCQNVVFSMVRAWFYCFQWRWELTVSGWLHLAGKKWSTLHSPQQGRCPITLYHHEFFCALMVTTLPQHDPFRGIIITTAHTIQRRQFPMRSRRLKIACLLVLVVYRRSNILSVFKFIVGIIHLDLLDFGRWSRT